MTGFHCSHSCHRGLAAAAALAAALGAAPLQAQSITLVPIAEGLTDPTYVTHAGDGSGRLFITEQPGKIKIWDGAQVLPTPFLDIESLTTCCGERGLLSIAFHPNYPVNGFFFVNYTDNGGDTVVARYRVSPADPNVANPSTGKTIITIDQPFANHNGGQLQFGPDGYLYIGMGDGGSSGDPNNNAQDLDELLGKMLRLDVDSGIPYGIPPDNPYVGIAGLDEIWANGLRNPWRFSFDRLTGDLFTGDVGQNLWEEIDFQPAASTGCENYGWRLMEASQCFNPPANCQPGPPSGCNPNGDLVLPIIEYFHSNNNCSVTGGYRYRGTAIPELYATYLYSDYCTGTIWGAKEVRKEYLGPPVEEGVPPPPPPPAHVSWKTSVLLDTNFNVVSFGEDEQGEIYVAALDGLVLRVTAPVGLAPGSGTYSQTQQMETVVSVYETGAGVEAIDLAADGVPLEGWAGVCLPSGRLPHGGQTFSCPNVKASLEPGIHQIRADVRLTDGRSFSSSATWRIEADAERGR